MKNIIDVLEINKNTNPDKLAVICEENTLTYSELYEYSDRLSNILKEMGLKKGDIVALMFPNIMEFVVSYFAILKAGGIVVPINVVDKPEDIKYVIEDAGVKYIVHWDKFERIVDTISKHAKNRLLTVALGGKDLKEQLSYQYSSSQMHDKYERIVIEENDVSCVHYTSGTTGRPMGAMHSHKNLGFVAEVWKELLSIASYDIFLAILPLFHPFSQTAILIPSIWFGATIVMHPRLNIDEAVQVINKNKVTLLYVVPSVLRSLLHKYEQEKFEIPSVRLCVSGINACTEKDERKFEEIFKVQILESYGTAETLFITACSRIDKMRKPNSVGFPIKEVEMQIVDERNNVLSTDEMGELLIRGESNLIGYINHPEHTCKVLKKGWFCAGDIGKQDEDGYFYIMDKKFDVIKKGGFSVYPTEVELVLMENENIREAAVIGVPDGMKIAEVKAFITLNEGAQIDKEEIIKFCKTKLPVYKCPKYIEFYDSLPKSSTGKILRKELKSDI